MATMEDALAHRRRLSAEVLFGACKRNEEDRLLGYPGEDLYQCLDSPLNNYKCDGWMYRDSNSLDVGAYYSNYLRYDVDATAGQSGAAVFTYTNGSYNVMGVHRGYSSADNWAYNRGSRFRAAMWNDVCYAIGARTTSYCSHSLCN